MVRFIKILSATILLLMAAAYCSYAFTLIEPSAGQNVKENVKIAIPQSIMPPGGFIGIFLISDGQERFVTAINSSSAIDDGQKFIFKWDSKIPYADPSDAKTQLYFQDGKYELKVQVQDSSGKMTDSATVPITLKNKIARSNPAPKLSLFNRLEYGQVTKYGFYAYAQIYDSAGQPILGELGLSAVWNVIESVEDVDTEGTRLLRYRIGDKAYYTISGIKQNLYQNQKTKPQLYRKMDKFGNVSVSNVFNRQKDVTITDIEPVLPSVKVKEGDSWNDELQFKIEGITNYISLKGKAVFDSMEWESGQKCVKIISELKGSGVINLAQGMIDATDEEVKASIVTYLSISTHKLVKRQLKLDFPVVISANAGGMMGSPTGQMGPGMPNTGYDENDEDMMGPGMPPGMGAPGMPPGGGAMNRPMPGGGMAPGMGAPGMPPGAGGAYGLPGRGLGGGVAPGVGGAGYGSNTGVKKGSAEIFISIKPEK